jgi:hypothetical protein
MVLRRTFPGRFLPALLFDSSTTSTQDESCGGMTLESL